MRAKSLVLLLLALGCGLVAAVGVTQVMGKRGDSEGAAEVVSIFVAVKDIPQSEPIIAQMVKQEEWPRDKVPILAVTKWEDLHTRRPKATIFSGSPILDNQLLGKGQTDRGPGTLIEKGSRVIGVKVDSEAAIGSIIRPGDRVDVLVHVRADPNRGLPETVTLGVLQNVKVFAVNDSWEAQGSEKAVAAKTVSLQVTPAEAQLVMLAAETGQIRLLMRGPDDDKKVEYPLKRLSDIVGIAAEGKGKSGTDEVIWAAIRKLQAKPQPKPAAASVARPTNTGPKNQQYVMVVLHGDRPTATLLEAAPGEKDTGIWRVKIPSDDDAQTGDKQKPAKETPTTKRAADADAAMPGEETTATPDGKETHEGQAADPVKKLETLQKQMQAAQQGHE
jgi:Flp pilus assembly protein CpaB